LIWKIASQKAGRALLSTPGSNFKPGARTFVVQRKIFNSAFDWLFRRHFLLEAVAGDPCFPASCQLLAGSCLSVHLHYLLAALRSVVHRDVVILAHKLLLQDAGKWKHPEDIVNDVQQAVSKDLFNSCSTIWPATEKTNDWINAQSRSSILNHLHISVG
jgi:hypothetical protein